MTATTPPLKTPPWDPAPHRGRHQVLLIVQAGRTEVLRYVDGTGSPAFDSPRPHLHPVRTRGGVVVTDAAPADHTWHHGVSIGVQDVEGNNLWGGRTYLPQEGYTWRHDHGTVQHDEWLRRVPGTVSHRLVWSDAQGTALLEEVRDLTWTMLDDSTWQLDLSFELTLPADRTEPVTLGSPGSHGRALGGYGGMFWRVAACHDVDLRTPLARGEEAVHGSRPADGATWLAWSATADEQDGPGGDFTVAVAPADEATAGDPWFTRVDSYPGIGSALAWSSPARVTTDAPLRRSFTWVVADGRLDDDAVTRLLTPSSAAPADPAPTSADRKDPS
ncbi:PmoA family protein [Actinotalea sp. K2]|uniref:DUF6807 domain-containing protein n=1 Tax=Actinotalea sp. K2 TaxID=2939438 RepID=UPI0020175560|nr:PmoA family protein [Actinotalea sp. K2]MCL3859402.1 PmoA family protein [Actinotalea sp. K2]